MLIEPQIVSHGLLGCLMDTLTGLPGVQAELNTVEPDQAAGADEHDIRIGLQVEGKPVTLRVKSRKNIYPRDARQILWQLREAGSNHQAGHADGELVLLLVADSISQGAVELLRKERCGYFDGSGSLYLPISGAYIYIEKPAPKKLTKLFLPLFSERRTQVLHALLLRHQEWFNVKKLSKLAMVSPATVSQVLAELERLDWVSSRGQGPGKERHLDEPAKLLDAWAKQSSPSRFPITRRYYVPDMKQEKLIERIGKVFDAHEVKYAVGWETAAQRYAPFLTSISQVRCRLLASQGSESALKELGARAVGEGANLMIAEAKSAGELLFCEQVGGIRLDSPIQVYIDLLHVEGRAREMAEHLRKERIGF